MSGPGRVVVVGGGISGLTTAYRLAAAGVDVTVYEASDRPGGKLATAQVGDLRLEAGADSFVARRPWAVDLCRELGLAGELVSPGAKGAYLWTDHGLVAFPKDAPFGIPGDIGDVFRWPGVSRAGRRRAAQDLLRGKRKDGVEETLGGLLRRRLGDEVTDMAVAPLLAGLYAGDIDRLSASATFPELLTWESAQGSLIRGSQAAMRSARRGTPTPMFVKPKGGVGRLTDALAASLGDRVVTGAPVGSLTELGESGEASATVLAVPAFEAARLLGSAAPAPAAAELSAIPYASTGVVFLVYGEGTQAAMPDGTGFVVPRGKAPMTACTWISSKWPDPAFGSRAVVRCFVGGVGDEDVLEAADEELVDACARHLAAVLDLPTRPEASSVVRWIRAMPQYEVGHVERVHTIRRNLPAGIFVVGSAYDGVGIPDCVRAAAETADHVLAHRDRTTTEKETAR
ncbi:MAG: protoporphyrinogen oxidase [Actinomycetota bacterium]